VLSVRIQEFLTSLICQYMRGASRETCTKAPAYGTVPTSETQVHIPSATTKTMRKQRYHEVSGGISNQYILKAASIPDKSAVTMKSKYQYAQVKNSCNLRTDFKDSRADD